MSHSNANRAFFSPRLVFPLSIGKGDRYRGSLGTIPRTKSVFVPSFCRSALPVIFALDRLNFVSLVNLYFGRVGHRQNGRLRAWLDRLGSRSRRYLVELLDGRFLDLVFVGVDWIPQYQLNVALF